jgi:hypothetical protein
MLRHIPHKGVSGDFTAMACNPIAGDSFNFATGSHDGAVRLWAPFSWEGPNWLPKPSSSSLPSPSKPNDDALSRDNHKEVEVRVKAYKQNASSVGVPILARPITASPISERSVPQHDNSQTNKLSVTNISVSRAIQGPPREAGSRASTR